MRVVKNLNDNFWQFDDASRRRKGLRAPTPRRRWRNVFLSELVPLSYLRDDGLGGAAVARAAAELLLAAGGDRAQVLCAEAAEQQRGLRRDLRGHDCHREEGHQRRDQDLQVEKASHRVRGS